MHVIRSQEERKPDAVVSGLGAETSEKRSQAKLHTEPLQRVCAWDIGSKWPAGRDRCVSVDISEGKKVQKHAGCQDRVDIGGIRHVGKSRAEATAGLDPVARLDEGVRGGRRGGIKVQGSRGEDSMHDVRNASGEAPNVDSIGLQGLLVVHVGANDINEVVKHFEVVLSGER